jgi:valyl-tRNA synthetase
MKTHRNMEVPKKYNQKEEEANILKLWSNQKTFVFSANIPGELFSIDTPPPTVSGKMHIGHSFSYTVQDTIARYKRMQGFNVFYPFGTDDNGLPTERLVEKLKKVHSISMDREEFRKLAYATVIGIKDDFVKDWIQLGMSCDMTKSYSTIDKLSQKLAQKSFINLYKKGLIYQQEAPMSWCPACQTAIAQAEFESKDITSWFNDIIFKSEGTDLVISTTRPEFLPACVALFAHPEDERYVSLKGKTAIVPLFNYEVPILFDEAVDKEKGTGLMMVCTFGDKEDIDKWKRYDLPLKIVITKDGRMNDAAGKYAGMKIVEARKQIVEDLKSEKLLTNQKEIVHAVNVHERDGVELEFLVTKQWFIKVLENKEMLLDEVNKIEWHPQYMKQRIVHWIENLNWDWCISRQRHFGIPFPVWHHKKTGEIIIADESQLPIDPIDALPKGYTAEEVEPETDVMDTWATSALTPQIAAESYAIPFALPTNLRPQGHDIIRTWAFYTLVRNIYENNTLPWKHTMISGFVRTSTGDKMSKSKGNVISPQAILEKHSADSLRFWACGAKLGEDLLYKEQDLDAGNRLLTKIWNAFKFASYFIEEKPQENPTLTVIDTWMFTQLNDLIEKNTKSFDAYEYDKVKYRTEQFFWTIFCDQYLEIVKDRLYKPEIYGKEAQESGAYTTYHVLKAIIQMLHPIIPFITESIWQYFYKQYEKAKTIAQSSWPKKYTIEISNEGQIAGQLAMDITAAVRRFKSNAKKPLNTEIIIKILADEKIKRQILLVESDIKGTAKASKIEFVTKIRGDLALNEAESEELEIQANEKDIPKKSEFFAFDIEFTQSL